jgi:Domain of unknown function (DUF6930)
VTVARKREKLQLGKGVAFVKSQLRWLHQEDETWEADFRALPQAITQSATHYLGMVLTQPDGFLLAESEVEQKPTVNDLATLLANAMRRPFVEGSHRPRRIHLRGQAQWQELIPHLKEVGIEVVVRSGLPKVTEAYRKYLQDVNEQPAGKVKPSAETQNVEKLFPAIAQWVRDGHIEIGNQEGFGFVVRALDDGGLVFEDDKPETLTEAMASLERGIRTWCKEQGIELEG